jgi:hypothetical protein
MVFMNFLNALTFIKLLKTMDKTDLDILRNDINFAV